MKISARHNDFAPLVCNEFTDFFIDFVEWKKLNFHANILPEWGRYGKSGFGFSGKKS